MTWLVPVSGHMIPHLMTVRHGACGHTWLHMGAQELICGFRLTFFPVEGAVVCSPTWDHMGQAKKKSLTGDEHCVCMTAMIPFAQILESLVS